METLFPEEYPEDNSAVDDTQITTTLLYFSETELKEFKRLAKQGMKKMFGTEYQFKGNLSDLLLNLLKQYATTDAEAQT